MKIIFNIPGERFSKTFLFCWDNLAKQLNKKGIDYILNIYYHPEVYEVRNLLLGGNRNLSKDQMPYQGKIDYDYMMWIDSDIIFKSKEFFKLLDHDKNIVSGLYYKQPGNTIEDIPHTFACSKTLDKALMLMDIQQITNSLIEVHGNGMGFMLVKYGVFESIEYPWFENIRYEKDDCIKHFSEDIVFQRKAKEKGFISYVDPSIIVGHEKTLILI